MKPRWILICRLFGALSFAVLGGCMVGPKYSRPQTAAEDPVAYVHAGDHSQDSNSLERFDKWWTEFGDPVTADLVELALRNNHDLKAAAARVLQAEAALAEARGRQLPDVSFGINRDRSKRSFNLGAGPFGGGRFSVMSTTWSQGLTVNYILDIFGKLRHAERAAWADMLTVQANEQALVNSVIAAVINARISIATIQRRLAIAKANTASRRDTLEIVERRYGKGLVGPVDVRLARENLEAALALEPSIELSLATAHHALDVLVARAPGTSEFLPKTLPDLPDLEPVPIGLPAALLDRRPDVRASEMALVGGNELIGVSIAQLFPDLTLTATYGGSGDRWRDIWEHYAETYSLLTQMVQPVFRGGQIRARIEMAKARYEELASNYAGTVLIAMREVEDALVGETMLSEQLEHVRLRLKEATAAEELSRQRYQRGVETILTVLESERRRRTAEEQLALLKGQIWTTRVNLFLALGGDWDYEEEQEG
jgi:multidrug efflux system outer membrane protein